MNPSAPSAAAGRTGSRKRALALPDRMTNAKTKITEQPDPETKTSRKAARAESTQSQRRLGASLRASLTRPDSLAIPRVNPCYGDDGELFSDGLLPNEYSAGVMPFLAFATTTRIRFIRVSGLFALATQ